MYEYVVDKEVKRYRSDCSNTMEQLRDLLNEKYDINTQFSLVGSGGDSRNMVTRNGDGPFDLDYNLVIISMPNEYWNNLKMLKDRVRDSLNKVVDNTWFSDGKDSRSVITSILHFKDSTEIEFSFDIAILTRNSNGNLCRLIHNNKGCWNENFTWNEVPHSKNVKDKADKLKRNGLWNLLRDVYLDKKNMCLSRGDKNHPSFVIYVESVNEVCNRYF